MGVDILWLMPIHPIGLINRKGSLGSYYSIRDFFDVNPEFGTKADFRNLVSAAHRLELKVIIDWVANHAAYDNTWVKSNPDFFLKDDKGQFISPYDWSDVIQIDHSSEAAHDALRAAMLYWIQEFDVDGFRADLAHLTPLHFWIKARQLTESIKPNLIWLAESEDMEYYQAFDILYAWPWMRQADSYFRNRQETSWLIQMLRSQQPAFPSHALQLYFTTNHDENSWNGTEYEKYGVCAKALAVFSFTYPRSVPLIYSGQEIPNLKRLLFFDKDELCWVHGASLENFYSTLIKLRKTSKAPDSVEFIPSGNKILAFKRGNGENSLLVFLNLDEKENTVEYQDAEVTGIYRDIFDQRDMDLSRPLSINLEPGGFLVLEK